LRKKGYLSAELRSEKKELPTEVRAEKKETSVIKPASLFYAYSF